MTQNNTIIDVIVGMIGELPHGIQGVGPQTNIIRDLGLDSLTVMNFVMALEDHFDVSIPMDRLADIETVGDLAAAIADLKGR